MRVKVLLIIATIIVAGILALAVTANAAFATSIELQQTISNGASSVTQSSTQTSSGLPGTQTSSSHNQLVVGPNQGNTVSAASGSDPKGGGYGASSGISQSNTQSTFCLAITSNSDSCNQIAANFNFGNAISTAIAQFGAR
jgi:hypothetical protein